MNSIFLGDHTTIIDAASSSVHTSTCLASSFNVQKDDLKTVVRFLRDDEHVSLIGLWGRSMGAVTSLMYGAEDPSIAGMVLDSPFANLVDLMMELVDVYKIRLPKFTVKVAVQYMRKVIQKKAHFDIMDLDVIQVAAKSFIPALFGHASEDAFIQPHHSDLICNSYAGDKNIIKFEGDHNSPRPQFYYDSITIFFHNVLHPPDDLVKAQASECFYEYIDELENLDENVWRDITSDQGFTSNSLHQPNALEFNANSTEDAISLSRARWQMSRTEVPANFADDSENHLDLHHVDDSCRDEMLPSKSSDTEGRIQNLLQMKENGSAESSCSKIFNVNESVADKHSSDSTLSGDPTNQNANGFQASFAQFPLTAEDEQKMLMEALAASLRDFEIRQVYQEENSKVAETKPCHCESETTLDNTIEGLNKEEICPTSKVNISCADSSQTESVSPRRIETETEEKCSNLNPSISVLEGLTHRWGNFFRKRQE